MAEFDPDDQAMIRLIALFCASMAMSGRQHSRASEVINMAKEFEEYIIDEVME